MVSSKISKKTSKVVKKAPSLPSKKDKEQVSLISLQIPSFGLRDRPFTLSVQKKDLPLWIGIALVVVFALSSKGILIWNEEVVVLLCFLTFLKGVSQYGGGMIGDIFGSQISAIQGGLGSQTKAEMQSLEDLETELSAVVQDSASLGSLLSSQKASLDAQAKVLAWGAAARQKALFAGLGGLDTSSEDMHQDHLKHLAVKFSTTKAVSYMYDTTNSLPDRI